MRKTLVFMVILVMICTLAFTACTPAESSCEQHTPGQWTVTKQATCTEEGERTSTCTVCGSSITEKIAVDPDNHINFSDWAIVKEPTCTEEGLRQRTCLDCGEKVDEAISVDSDAHVFGSWKTVQPSTCRVYGTEERACVFCDHKETRQLPLDPEAHTWEMKEEVASTCAVQGYTLYECKDCHQQKKDYLPLTTDHTFGTSGGFDHRCTVCGEILEDTVTLNTTNVIGEVGYSVLLQGDFKLIYTFNNFGGENVNGWHNWSLQLLPAIYDNNGTLRVLDTDTNGFLDIRARDVDGNMQFRYLKEQGTFQYDPEIVDGVNDVAFGKAMKDATCTAVIERIGDVLNITVTAVSNVDGSEYKFTAQMPIIYDALSVALTGESCTLELTSAKVVKGNLAEQTTEPDQGQEQLEESITFVNEGTRQHNGYSLSLAEGDFDVSFLFVNNGAGSDWHNYYFNVYKCYSESGSDSDVLWAFAANNEEPTFGYTFTSDNWTGVGLNTNSQYGYGQKVSDFAQLLKDAKVYIRMVRTDGIMTVYGVAYTNDDSRSVITSILYRSQGQSYDGALTIRLMGENCSVTLESVQLYAGQLQTDHIWGEWETVSEAVCGTDGLKQRVCQSCGHIETQSIPATGMHSWSEWETENPATCGQSGSETRHCTQCTATESRTVPPTGEHTFSVNEWGVNECEVCGELLEQSVEVNNQGLNFTEKFGYTFTGNFEIVYTFTNYGGENINGWHNWSVWILPAVYENGQLQFMNPTTWNSSTSFVQVRSRAVQGFGALNLNAVYSPVITDGNNDREFAEAMKDATVTAIVKRVGDTVTIDVTSVSNVAQYLGKTYRCTVSYDLPYENLYVSLTGEQCKLNVTSARRIDGTLTATTTDSVLQGDLLTEEYTFTNVDREGNGYTLSLSEGDFDVTYVFENRGGTGNADGYHNFYFNFYKGITEASGKTDVLWAIAPNGLEPTWEYQFTDGDLFGCPEIGQRGDDFVNKMQDAIVYLRITRTNGVITVTGHTYTNEEQPQLIGSVFFVSDGTYSGEISLRLMSEKAEVTLQHVYLTEGTVAVAQ